MCDFPGEIINRDKNDLYQKPNCDESSLVVDRARRNDTSPADFISAGFVLWLFNKFFVANSVRLL